jgi:hypothetical protein
VCNQERTLWQVGCTVPVGLPVVLNQLIADAFDVDEPTRNCLVDQWSFGAPAEWILVSNGAALDDTASILEALLDVIVGFLCEQRRERRERLRLSDLQDQGNSGRSELRTYLDVNTCMFGNLRGESTVGIDWTWNVDALLDNTGSKTDSVIVLAERWCLMYDTGTSLGLDILVRKHTECAIFLKLCSRHCQAKQNPPNNKQQAQLPKLVSGLGIVWWIE